MSEKILMLIDGNSLLHRAFYALPQLSNKEGIFTNGVYGFMTMYYKMIENYNPDFIGIVFDKKAPTFRHKEYVEYKAGRKKTPSELGMQFPILKEVLDKLNVTRMELDGFEADDLAGTMAKYGEENGLNVLLVTGDKDYLQLVSDKTKVLITKKGISETEVFDEEKMNEKFGITSQQFIDLKGLMGDKSDNIPGIPGVGEKTGLKLIKEYGSIEGVYDNIDKISGKKLKEKLIDNKHLAFLSKKLAKIIINVPIKLNLSELERKEPDYDSLVPLFKKLEFNSLLSKLNLNIPETEVKTLEVDYEIIANSNDIQEFNIDRNEENKLFFKFVHNGSNYLNDDIVGLVLQFNNNKIHYYHINDNEELDILLKKLRVIFEDNNIKKCGHNLKEDIIILLRNNIELKNIEFDSLIAEYLIDSTQNDYSLSRLSNKYLDINYIDLSEILGKGKNKKGILDLSLEERAEIFAKTIYIINNLENKLLEKIKEYDMESLYNDVEMPLIEVLAYMEFYGFKVDINKLNDLGIEFNEKIEILTKEIYEISEDEFNINSPKQLGKILFEKIGLEPIKKTKTGYSTSAEVLEKLSGKHEIINKILEYRHIVKLKSTYVDGLLNLIDTNTNRIHSKFNQTITTTGRISSTEPNLQNIPIRTEEGRKLRKVFIPDESFKLVDADYSQIELRVLGHISSDPKLKEAFETDEDIHTKTASEVFGVEKDEVTSLMRSRAKAVNFGIVYGISDYGLSRDLKIPRKEAKVYIDNYLNNYVKVKDYMNDSIENGKKEGYVTTILNRRRYVPELSSRNFNIRSFGERLAMNTPIQGSAADIIKIAMVNVYKELKKSNMKSRLILQVHDELIIEAHKEEVEKVKEMLRNLMEKAVDLSVPLKVDMEVGDSWYETK